MRSVLAVLLCVACTPPVTEPDPLVPPATYEPAWVMDVDGVFFPRTTATLHDELLPPPNGTAATLHAYVEAPGTTMLALADAADLPVLAALRAQLPAGAADQLGAWFDAAMNANVLGQLGVYAIAEALELVPHQILVESELVVDGRRLTHRPLAIYFEPDTLEDRVEIATLAAAITEQQTTATITPTSSGGHLELAHRGVDLPLGELRWRNLDRDGDLRTNLVALASCPIAAANVAGACGGACTAQLCERGVELVIEWTRREQGALRLRLAAGSVVPIDRDADEVADELFGTWTATLATGDAAAGVHATFVARRSLVH